MIALVLAALLQQDLPAPEVSCVELTMIDVRNSELQGGLVAEGAVLNRSPYNLGGVSVDVVIIGDNKFPIKSMPKQAIGAMPGRKGVGFLVKDAGIPQATRFTYKLVIRYTVEGQERATEYDGPVMKAGKLYIDPDPGPKAGVMGLRTIAGSYKSVNKQQVYTGDTLFLLLSVDNLDGAAGSLDVTITSDGKKQAPVHRSIDAGHWKVDLAKLPANDADPKIVCYDGRRKELWIGLRRVEDQSKLGNKVTMDVKFSGKGGSWSWTGLESPYLEALRPPDKK